MTIAFGIANGAIQCHMLLANVLSIVVALVRILMVLLLDAQGAGYRAKTKNDRLYHNHTRFAASRGPPNSI